MAGKQNTLDADSAPHRKLISVVIVILLRPLVYSHKQGETQDVSSLEYVRIQLIPRGNELYENHESSQRKGNQTVDQAAIETHATDTRTRHPSEKYDRRHPIERLCQHQLIQRLARLLHANLIVRGLPVHFVGLLELANVESGSLTDEFDGGCAGAGVVEGDEKNIGQIHA